MQIQRLYQAQIDSGSFQPDPLQEQVVQTLDALLQQLLTPPKPRSWFKRHKQKNHKGLYIWGGVGRGKTWLMDQFYEQVTLPKQRWHGLRFMQSIHAKMHEMGKQPDPLPRIAKQLAKDARLLCLDEFNVTDIGDAMILAGLLKALFQEGVTLVCTSNLAPEQLYADGIQRASFLPAIDLLESHCKVTHLGGTTDYRHQYDMPAPGYYFPKTAEHEAAMLERFQSIARGTQSQQGQLSVLGRHIAFKYKADNAIWFEFNDLLGHQRGANDYLDIARRYEWLFVSCIPQLDNSLDDRTRRFIHLVDECYDRRVKLILLAQVPCQRLYCGERLAFEFQRTQSRLREMQTEEYLKP